MPPDRSVRHHERPGADLDHRQDQAGEQPQDEARQSHQELQPGTERGWAAACRCRAVRQTARAPTRREYHPTESSPLLVVLVQESRRNDTVAGPGDADGALRQVLQNGDSQPFDGGERIVGRGRREAAGWR